jgi:formylglycine-generating enzyme required for sulfatase activity
VPGARPCREDEWERATRGADGRAFPHGDELKPGDANWDATYDKQPLAFGPDEVGQHAESDSPFGLSDAAGNVWEWNQSVLKRGELVARGGSFYFPTPSARSANREPIEPTLRDLTIGLRVCADPAR